MAGVDQEGVVGEGRREMSILSGPYTTLPPDSRTELTIGDKRITYLTLTPDELF